MSVNSKRNPEMTEVLSADFRRLYNPTHALGDAIDMMQSLPVCRALYPGSVNGGGGGSGGITDAPSDNFMYVRRNAAWVSGGYAFQNPIGIGITPAAGRILHVYGAGEIVRLQGTLTGNANVNYLSFTDNASTAIGFVGEASASNTDIYLGANSSSLQLYANGASRIIVSSTITYVDNTLRVRQVGASRYRSDRYMSGNILQMNAYDDTGTTYVNAVFAFNTLSVVNQNAGSHVLRLRSSAATSPYLDFSDPTGATRYGYLQGSSANVWLASDAGQINFQPQTGDGSRVIISRVTGTINSPRITLMDSTSNSAALLDLDTSNRDLRIIANATNTRVTIWANGAVQAGFGLNGASGVTVGGAGGGALGLGRINVSSGVYLNNSAYTNPDYALEYWVSGKIVRFRNNVGASTYKRYSLEEMEEYIRTNLRLPRITDEPMDMFERGDHVLAFIEELYTHIIELNHRLKSIEQGNK